LVRGLEHADDDHPMAFVIGREHGWGQKVAPAVTFALAGIYTYVHRVTIPLSSTMVTKVA
jgi:hypothetical protein